MILHEHVLRRGWVPQDVVHRNTEKNRLRDALEPLVTDVEWAPEHVLIDGPSGSGKTCLAKHALQELERHDQTLATTYVDGWQRRRRYRVLEALVDGLGQGHHIKRTTPHDELLAMVEAINEPYVVVLDEADRLDDPNLLHDLLAIPDLTLVMIVGDARAFLGRLDQYLRPRVSRVERIEFDAYDTETLLDILTVRADQGLDGGVGDPAAGGSIDAVVLWELAEAARGNAHDAVEGLRLAAKAATRDGSDHITVEHIRAAIPEAREHIRQKHVSRLEPDPRAVYEILVEADEAMSSSAIHGRYAATVDDPRSIRTVRRYLADLVSYNLIEQTGEGPARRYWVETQTETD